jgi:hypothetical protein
MKKLDEETAKRLCEAWYDLRVVAKAIQAFKVDDIRPSKKDIRRWKVAYAYLKESKPLFDHAMKLITTVFEDSEGNVNLTEFVEKEPK